jgi:hypothetical protein
MVSLDALASLMGAATADQIGDVDEEGHARGPCRCCRGARGKSRTTRPCCFAFASRGGWKGPGPALPLAAITLPSGATHEAVEAAHRVYQEALARLESAPDGAVCARCGCKAAEHMTRRDLMRHQRELDAGEAAARGESAKKSQRVEAAKQRARRAAAEGTTLHETTADMMSGAERLGCGQCGPARCRQFKCVFTEGDTVDPEIMLFCSTCGCEAECHAVCPSWRGQQDAADARRRAEDATRRNDREQRERERRELGSSAAAAEDESTRSKHLAALGLLVHVASSPSSSTNSASASRWGCTNRIQVLTHSLQVIGAIINPC